MFARVQLGLSVSSASSDGDSTCSICFERMSEGDMVCPLGTHSQTAQRSKQARIHICTHADRHTHTHTHTHTLTHSLSHTHTHRVRLYTFTHKHTHTHLHTLHRHTQTDTHRDTHTHTLNPHKHTHTHRYARTTDATQLSRACTQSWRRSSSGR